VALEAWFEKEGWRWSSGSREIGPERKIPAPFRWINAAHVSLPLGLRIMLSHVA